MGSCDSKLWNEYELYMVAMTLVALVTMAAITIDQNMHILSFGYVFTGIALETCITYQRPMSIQSFPTWGLYFAL